jgi:hypothetical protein
VILITHVDLGRVGLDRVLRVHYDEQAGVSRIEQSGGDVALADDLDARDEYAEAVAGGAD